MSGFNTLRDVIEVLIVPLVILVLGIWLPRLFEFQRRNTFINLIRRELWEMTPYPSLEEMQASPLKPEIEHKMQTIRARWPEHLSKRFVHEEIFANISDNRDFILSLPPDLTYYLSQLWIEHHKAKKRSERLENPKNADPKTPVEEWCNDPDLKAHVIQWHYYLRETCCFLDSYGKMASFSESDKQDKLHSRIFMQWHELLLHYYPDLKELEKTNCQDKASSHAS